ncbi:MAG: carbohydrate binding domain-containing protein [Pontiellaceae bacterium]|jgi:hypothetical protein|nr:carbohydrate binding domain-containing protein [Pontiellaceae bacterium]
MRWLTGICIAAVTAGSPPAFANQIQNGSFETGTASGWTLAPSEVTVSSAAASDGSYSLKLQTADGAIASTTQTIPVQANTDYVFAYDINYSSGSTGEVTAKLTFDGLTLKTVTTNSTDGWTRRQTWFNSRGATQIQLNLYATNNFNGLVYVDDFSLETMAPPYAYETWTVDTYKLWAALNAVSDHPDEDKDNDGFNNLYEYAFAGNPTNALNQGTAPTFVKEGNQFMYRCLQRNNDTNLTYCVEVCTNLLSGNWTEAGFATVTNETIGDFNDVGYIVPTNGSGLYVRIKSTRPAESLNDGWFELIAAATNDHRSIIQNTLDKLHKGATLKLFGNFFIRDTLYLPSDFRWILDGSLSLGNGVRNNLDDVGWVGVVQGVTIDARRETGVSEKSGGAKNIDMSGGTYNGNSISNSSSLRFINFVAVTNCYFHDMVITNVSDDNFTLGHVSRSNLCRNIRSAYAISGNALSDKGSHNKWFDCIAEYCLGDDGDGWTPKCRFSEFYRCIGRRNGGPGFGMYCRMDGSPSGTDVGENIDGNKFYACESYENWGGAGFSFNISDNNGIGATIRSNYIEAVCYSNQMSGLYFRNKLTNGIVAANEVNLLCWGNRGLTSTNSPSSIAAGMTTDGGSGYMIKGITGSIVAFDNLQNYDVNLAQASNCTITVYRPAGEVLSRVNRGPTSNIITVTNVSAASPSDPWCVHAYYNATNIP